VDNPSSISSSRPHEQRLKGTPGSYPVAAFIALLIAIVIDNTLFALPLFWRNIEVPENLYNLLELGLVSDRLEMLDAEGSPIFLIGSSRLQHGFAPEQIPSLGVSHERLVKLAHPQFFPLEMRAVAETVAGYKPEIVVLALSELETHGALDLQSASSFGNFDAVWDLVTAMGLGFTIDNRTDLICISLNGWLNTYHYRAVLDRAWLGEFRNFVGREGLQRDSGESSGIDTSLPPHYGALDERALLELVAELDAEFPGRTSIARRPQFHALRSISSGEHAQANLRLLKNTIEILTEEGAKVVIVEPPLYPRARLLYDDVARNEFVNFAEQAAMHELVRFVPLPKDSTFGAQDFHDLTHLNSAGARSFSRIVIDAISAELMQSGSDAR
jgi:hypothetical protein